MGAARSVRLHHLAPYTGAMKLKPIHCALTLLALPLLTGCNAASRGNLAMPATTAPHYGTFWGGRIPAAMPTEGKVGGLPTYGVPHQLPGRNTWISSFVLTKDPWIFRDSDPYSEGGLAGSGISQVERAQPAQLQSVDVRWHDAVFSNGQGTESWSLLNKRGFISHWWLMIDAVDGAPLSRFSVFSAVVNDTNDDGVLNDKDAVVAILTDGNGRHAEVATPEHMQLAAVHYMPETEMLGFEVRED